MLTMPKCSISAISKLSASSRENELTHNSANNFAYNEPTFSEGRLSKMFPANHIM